MKHYREIPEDKILKFKATPGFKGWEHFFDRKSIVHPAKMNLNLLKWILSNYTKESDTVLDPMAGTGSTAILASAMGRDGVALEYEIKFCKMIEDNIKKIKNHQTLTPKGKIICINGDARELSKLLEDSDVIITSPPYSQSMGKGGGGALRINLRDEWWGVGSGQYSDNKKNIGNLPHGDIDYIITSPPYGNRLSDVAVQDDDPARMGYRQSIDVVLTSPPYEESMGAKNPISTWTEEAKRTWWENYRSQGGGMKFEDFIKYQEKQEYSYSSDSENIGNLKSENYLEAMLQVYSESFNVLKPLGKMILVVKNFIRDKKVVRLDLDTIKLCEKVGFTLIDRLYFYLPIKSFWKRIYQQKYPDVPEVKYEDILIFEKPFDIKGEISKKKE